jgi:hypothetical protein
MVPSAAHSTLTEQGLSEYYISYSSNKNMMHVVFYPR